MLSVCVRVAVLAGLPSWPHWDHLVIWRSPRAMRSAADDVRAEARVPLRRASRFLLRRNPGFEMVSAPAVYLQGCPFSGSSLSRGTCWAAGILAGGSPASPIFGRERTSRHPRWWRWLRPSLADSREPELVIATANDGLLAFNGRSFSPDSASQRSMPGPSPRSYRSLPGIFWLEPRSAEYWSMTENRSPSFILRSMRST